MFSDLGESHIFGDPQKPPDRKNSWFIPFFEPDFQFSCSFVLLFVVSRAPMSRAALVLASRHYGMGNKKKSEFPNILCPNGPAHAWVSSSLLSIVH